MQFDSPAFMVFFLVVTALCLAFNDWRFKRPFLAAASLFFYACWSPVFTALLAAVILVTWFLAGRIHKAGNQGRRNLYLAASIVTTLSVLGYFKYANFFLEQLSHLSALFGGTGAHSALKIILPVGISFFTLQALGYCIDIYRRQIQPASLLDYTLFVSFFPHVTAGPIARGKDLLPQISGGNALNLHNIASGTVLFIFGIFLKIVLADAIFAPIVDEIFNNAGNVTMAGAWLGSVGFTMQLYADFAGYSTAAIGVACCLGFRLKANFNFPFASQSFQEFWTRWHISLSRWIRDFVFFPLFRTFNGSMPFIVLSLFLTMVISGLWHGAAWNYVIWGGLHGILLIANLGLSRIKRLPSPPAAVKIIVVFALLMFVNVIFRANSLPDAWVMVKTMLGTGSGSFNVSPFNSILALSVSLLIIAIHIRMRNTDAYAWLQGLPRFALAALLALMVFLILLAPTTERAFIYFQF